MGRQSAVEKADRKETNRSGKNGREILRKLIKKIVNYFRNISPENWNRN